jgi:predicted MFS family arabinose efflux permease
MLAGWLLQGLGYIALAMMRTYLPDYCTKVLAISTFHQGIIMAMISFSQAFTALACYKAHTWPYRPWTVVSVSLLGVIAFIIFAVSSNWLLYSLAAVLFGTFTGVMCFVATFHALVNTEKTPRYVSVNETLVGVGSVLAPLLGGFLASYGGLVPFFGCLVCLLICGSSYAAFTWKTRFLK